MENMLKTIDVRSDTITLPSLEMKNMMMAAPLGDDVFGEDPTVIKLQCQVAKLLGKEAGLFVPSGCMANLISVMIHCDQRGDELILGDQSHLYIWEQGSISQFGGVHPRTVRNKADGTFDLQELKEKVRGTNDHWPTTKAICIENTHNVMGGKALPLTWLQEFSKVVRSLNLKVHLDGARLLNAAFALNVDPKTLAECADSVSICMSKGLGAPVGSVIAGTQDFIIRARRLRKGLGGGMRQVGILAGAAIYGLDHAKQTLLADHANATAVAKAIFKLKNDYVKVNLEGVHSNILLIECDLSIVSLEDFCERMKQVPQDEKECLGFTVSILMLPMTRTEVRLAFNNGVSQEDTKFIIKKMTYVIKELTK